MHQGKVFDGVRRAPVEQARERRSSHDRNDTLPCRRPGIDVHFERAVATGPRSFAGCTTPTTAPRTTP